LSARLHGLFIVVAILASIASASLADEPTPAAPRPLPAGVDLRPVFKDLELAPKKQGARNTCSVCTTTSALEYELSRSLKKSRPLSVEYMNWAANQVTGNRIHDTGQFFHHLWKGLELHGVCADALMPYLKKFENPQPSDEARKDAEGAKVAGFVVHWIKAWSDKSGLTDAQMLEVKRAIAAGHPVAAGSHHSTLLVGYDDDDKAEGGGRFHVADSGPGKYVVRTYADVQAKTFDAFWVEIEEKPGVSR